jgi:hypothetical protein
MHIKTSEQPVITENPYSQDPTEWLAEQCPEFLPGARSKLNPRF